MNRERHIEIDCRGPKLIVFRSRIVFAARERVQANSFEPFFLAAFHFSDVFLDTDIGEYGNPHEPVRRDAAVLLDKVIIETAENPEKGVFVVDRGIACFSGKYQFRIDAVCVLFF